MRRQVRVLAREERVRRQSRQHVRGELLHRLIGAFGRPGGEAGPVHRRRGRREDRLAAELPAQGVEVAPRPDVGDDDLQRFRAFGPRRVGDGVADERLVHRLPHVQREVVVVPTRPVVHEGLADRVHEPDLGHLLEHPPLGPVHRRRVGEPAADHVGHIGEGVGKLRAVESLLPDLRDHLPVHGEGVLGRGGGDAEDRSRTRDRRPDQVLPHVRLRSAAWARSARARGSAERVLSGPPPPESCALEWVGERVAGRR